jgi:TRAP transporter 4TM/12TM fusion protein
LFGSISGSPAANVVGTGTFTIPMMKKIGYRPEFAGGVEAAASTGGAFMPPVMGSVAFLIAENLGIRYIDVVMAAVIPAVLYFIGCFTGVYFTALRLGLKGMAREELPKFWDVFKKDWVLLLGPAALVFFLCYGFSTMRSGLYGIIILIVTAQLKKSSRLSLRAIVNTMVKASKSSILIASSTACVGIVTGCIMQTGLGNKLSTLLIQFAHGNVLLLLVFTMIASLIMGMGLPTTPCYIILAVIVAPSIVALGMFEPIAVHLFLFYFGMLSFVTPPVAVAAYVAAGLAQAHVMKTAIEACKIAAAGLILPYIFVQNPQLLMMGSAMDIIFAVFTALIGVVALAGGLQGYILVKLDIPERILLLASAILLLVPGWASDIFGAAVMALVLADGIRIKRKQKLKMAN